MKKLVRIEKILVSRENTKRMMDVFQVSQASVYNALSFRSFSEQSERIREAALKNYGGRKVKVPTYVNVCLFIVVVQF